MDIILYLLQLIQYLYQQNRWLIGFICKFIPLKQWAFDDSHSPKYQKFKIDELPIVEKPLPKLNWEKIVAEYPNTHNGKTLKPIRRKKDPQLSKNCKCPRCDAPSDYIYRNNGKVGQLLCKVCGTTFFENVTNTFSKLPSYPKVRLLTFICAIYITSISPIFLLPEYRTKRA